MKPLASGTGNASGVTRQFLSGTRSVVSQTSVATFLGRLELYAPQFASSSPKSRINASFVSGSLLRTLPGRLLCARDVEEQLLRACVARQFTTTFGHAKRRHPSERPIMWSVAIDRLCGKLLGLRILDSCSILGPAGVAARGQPADILLKRMIMSRSQGYVAMRCDKTPLEQNGESNGHYRRWSGCMGLVSGCDAAGLGFASQFPRVATCSGLFAGGIGLFFLVSNFAVWAEWQMYPRTLAGLGACYVAALPFFRSSLTSELCFSLLCFGPINRVRPFTAVEIARKAHC